MIHPVGTLPVSLRHRVTQISFHPTESYLAVQSHERSIEIFNIRTEDEIKKKRARRKQRAREKAKKKKDKGDDVDDVDAEMQANDPEEEIGVSDLFSSYLTVRASGKIRSFDIVNAEVTAKGNVQVSSPVVPPRTVHIAYLSYSCRCWWQ